MIVWVQLLTIFAPYYIVGTICSSLVNYPIYQPTSKDWVQCSNKLLLR